MTREEILAAAKKCVCGDRDQRKINELLRERFERILFGSLFGTEFRGDPTGRKSTILRRSRYG